MNKRMKKLGVVFCLATAGAFAGAGIGALQTATVSATSTADLEMVLGASIRLDDPTGVKFSYEIAHYNENVDYGMLVVPYDYFEKANVAIADSTDYVTAFTNAYKNKQIPHAPAVGTELTVKVDAEGNHYAEYSVTGIRENNYDRKWFGIGFVDDGNGVYTYAQNNDNVRDVVSVASGELNAYYYDEDLPEDTKTAIQEELTTLQAFVTKGVANVTSELTYQVSGASLALVGDTLDYTLSVTEGVSLQSVWESSNQEVATVDQNGRVTCLTAGETTITAKSANIYSSSVTLTVYEKTREGLIAVNGEPDNYTVEVVTDTVKEGEQALKLTNTKGDWSCHFISIKGSDIEFDMNSPDWTKDVYVGFYVKTDSKLSIAPRFDNYQNGVSHNWYINFDGGYVGVQDIYASDEWQYVEWNLTELMASQTAWGDLYTENVTDWILKVGTCNEKSTFYIDGLNVYSKTTEELMASKGAENYTLEVVTDTVKEGKQALKCTATNGGYNSHFISLNGTDIEFDMSSLDWTKDVYVGFWIKTDVKLGMAPRMDNYQNGVSHNWYINYDGGYHGVKDISASEEWQYVEFNMMDVMMRTETNDYWTGDFYTENVTDWILKVGTNNSDKVSFYLDGFDVYNKTREELIVANGAFSKYTVEVVTDTVKEGEQALKCTSTETGNNAHFVGVKASDIEFDMNSLDWTKDVYVGFWVKTDYDLCIISRMQNCANGEWKNWYMNCESYYGSQNIYKSEEWQYVEFNMSDLMNNDTSINDYFTGELFTENVTDWELKIGTYNDIMSFYIDGLNVYNK